MSIDQYPISVAIGIIQDKDQFLITQRKDGTSFSGQWEFPGGKQELKESITQTLFRELEEEVNIRPLKFKQHEKIMDYNFPFTDCKAKLFFFHITAYDLTPPTEEVQTLKWVTKEELIGYDFIESDMFFFKNYFNMDRKREQL